MAAHRPRKPVQCMRMRLSFVSKVRCVANSYDGAGGKGIGEIEGLSGMTLGGLSAPTRNSIESEMTKTKCKTTAQMVDHASEYCLVLFFLPRSGVV